MTTDAHSEPTPDKEKPERHCDHSHTENFHHWGGRLEKVCLRCGKLLLSGRHVELGGGLYQDIWYG